MALALGETIEALAILIVLVLNAAIGFLTEWKAEQALTALRKQTSAVAHVIRDGEAHQVAAADLVPGDVALLAAGARVPADGRIIEGVRLRVEEAALTGESQPVAKTTDPIPDEHAPLADRVNVAFMGTTLADGRGRMIVTATGMRTEVGKIGALIEDAGDQDTPLEQKLAQLGRVLIGIVLGLCAVIVLAGWLRGINLLYMLEVGISLAIAAVPEGLPAVTTMTLALGMQRMARLRALVRRLPAVEILGSTTVICIDKTGTLTQNEMTVRALHLGAHGLPRLQRPLAAAVGVHGPPVHERLALGSGAGLPGPPGRRRLRPPLQAALRTVPLTATDWGIVGASSLAPVAVVELVKLGHRLIARDSRRRGG